MKKEDEWSQNYPIIAPDLPDETMNELLGIIDSLDNRKVDKVNWEERRLMNEATKRNGHLIDSGQEDIAFVESGEETTPDGEPIDETAGATSKKEKDLLSGMSNIMKDLEQLDGK